MLIWGEIIFNIIIGCAIFCVLWFDKSGTAEWVSGKLHMEKHRKKLSETVCIDKRCEGYKSLCSIFVLLSFLQHSHIGFLLLGSMMFLCTFVRWMRHAESMPFLNQKGLKWKERIPLAKMVLLLMLGFFLQFTSNCRFDILFFICVVTFSLFFTSLYAVSAAPQEKKEAGNYVICILLFGLLGFGVMCTANRYLKSEKVVQKQVVIQDVKTDAYVKSYLEIRKQDALLGQNELLIISEQEEDYKAGQIITIEERKGKLGMSWVRIVEIK